MYKRTQPGWKKHLDFIVLDMLCLHLAFVLAYYIRHRSGASPYLQAPYNGLAVVMTIVEISVAVLFNSMHNVVKRGWYVECAYTLKHTVMVFGVLTIYLFSAKSSAAYSRIVLYLMLMLHCALGYTVRMIWKFYLRSGGRKEWKQSMLVVTDEQAAKTVLDRLMQSSNESYYVSGVVMADGAQAPDMGVKVAAEMERAAEYICREWVDEVFFCVSAVTPQVQKLINQCREMGVVVHEALSIRDGVGRRQFVEKVGGYQVLTSSVNYATPLQATLKRLMDIVGGIVGLIATFFIVLIIGPKIKKASPGPIFFTQERIGKNGRRFKMVKIRSMYLDAEERKQALMKENRIADGMMFKMDFDPRIIGNEILPDGTKKTGIGAFIRRTSLDEFPQFFNVLMGDMSLVGTRPPTVDEWEKYDLHHRARLAIKPGITGMWQVNGRSEIIDFEEVVRLDTEYIYNWSMGLDLRILVNTVKVILGKDGAM